MNRRLLVGALTVALAISLVAPVGLAARQGFPRGITAREFLRDVAPELLSKFPVKALRLEVKFGLAAMTGTPSQTTDEPTIEGLDDIYVYCSQSFSANGKSVYYGASNTVNWPPFMRMPFMQVSAVLLEDGSTIDSTTKYGYNVWRVTTNDRRTVDGGAYYQMMSIHYVDYPAGYTPDAELTVLYSGVMWIDG